MTIVMTNSDHRVRLHHHARRQTNDSVHTNEPDCKAWDTGLDREKTTARLANIPAHAMKLKIEGSPTMMRHTAGNASTWA